jgi:hypothetical protein
MLRSVTVAVAAATAAVALLAPAAAAHAETKQPAYGVAAIRAHMVVEESGKIDPRDMTQHLMLWNTIIGEGDAEGPSSTTLIQVELAGPTFANLASGSLEVVVTAGGKKLLKQKLAIGTFFSEGTKLVVPFLVYDTGCDELAITATFTTPEKKKVKKTAGVPFACGE